MHCLTFNWNKNLARKLPPVSAVPEFLGLLGVTKRSRTVDKTTLYWDKLRIVLYELF
jgi:hypothetical protein